MASELQKEVMRYFDTDGQRRNVYMAGPIMHADDGGHGWRDELVEKYSSLFNWVNPLDFFDASEDSATLLPDEIADDYDPDPDESTITDTEIVVGDKIAVAESDAMLIGFPEVVGSWGTPQEQIYAWEHRSHDYAQPKKPIVVWHGDLDWERDCSPWLRYHATYHSASLEDCVHHLEAVLGVSPLCFDCRVDAGLEIANEQFKATGDKCEWCGNGFAVYPSSTMGQLLP